MKVSGSSSQSEISIRRKFLLGRIAHVLHWVGIGGTVASFWDPSTNIKLFSIAVLCFGLGWYLDFQNRRSK